MKREDWINGELAALRERDLYRHLTPYDQVGGKITVDGRTYVNFSSNDYLNLAHHPGVVRAGREALRAYGCGATASRLVTGTLRIHDELEQTLAAYKGYPTALVFGSGYLANAGAIPALAGRGDHVFADRLVHASIVDAIVMSRANLHRFRHNDANHLMHLLGRCRERGRRLIVTESVFSMDGDLAPLADLVAAADEHDAMVMIDEAHAIGVFGPFGSGLVREHGLEVSVNVSMGTLSKALAGYGGFVACSEVMREFLINRARALIYSTGLPPGSIGSALEVLRMAAGDGRMGRRLLHHAAAFRQRLKDSGLNTGDSDSQIVPIIVGESAQTLSFARRLRDRGILAIAIRPPTVPEGSARIRLAVTLAHTEEDLEWAASEIAAAAAEEGIA